MRGSMMLCMLIVIGLIALTLLNDVSAATVRWLPSGGGSFDISSNWDSGNRPVADDIAIIRCSPTTTAPIVFTDNDAYDSVSIANLLDIDSNRIVRVSLPLTLSKLVVNHCIVVIESPAIIGAIEIESHGTVQLRSAELTLTMAKVANGGRLVSELGTVQCSKSGVENRDAIINSGTIALTGPGSNSLSHCRLANTGPTGRLLVLSPLTVKNSVVNNLAKGLVLFGADSMSLQSSDDTTSQVVNHGEIRFLSSLSESPVAEQLVAVPVSNDGVVTVGTTSTGSDNYRLRFLASLVNNRDIHIFGSSQLSIGAHCHFAKSSLCEINDFATLAVSDGVLVSNGRIVTGRGSGGSVLIRTRLNTTGTIAVRSLTLEPGSVLTTSGGSTVIGRLSINGGEIVGNSGRDVVAITDGQLSTAGSVAKLDQITVTIQGTFTMSEKSNFYLVNGAKIAVVKHGELLVNSNTRLEANEASGSLLTIEKNAQISFMNENETPAILRLPLLVLGTLAVNGTAATVVISTNATLHTVTSVSGSKLVFRGDGTDTTVAVRRPVQCAGELQLVNVRATIDTGTSTASAISSMTVDTATITINDERLNIGHLRLGSKTTTGSITGNKQRATLTVERFQFNGGAVSVQALTVTRALTVQYNIHKVFENALIVLINGSQSAITDSGLTLNSNASLLVSRNASLSVVGDCAIDSNYSDTRASTSLLTVDGAINFVGKGETKTTVRTNVALADTATLTVSNSPRTLGKHRLSLQSLLTGSEGSVMLVSDRTSLSLQCPPDRQCLIGSVNGTGTVIVTSGHYDIHDTVTITRFTVNSGTVTMLRNFRSDIAIIRGGVLSLLARSVIDFLQWTSGTIVGKPMLGSHLTVTDVAVVFRQAALALTGLSVDVVKSLSVTHSKTGNVSESGILALANSARLSIGGDATMTVQSTKPISIVSDGTAARLVNGGRVTLNDRLTRFSVSVINTGTVTVQPNSHCHFDSTFIQSHSNASLTLEPRASVTANGLLISSGSLTVRDKAHLIGDVELGSSSQLVLVDQPVVNSNLVIANDVTVRFTGSDTVTVNGSVLVQGHARFLSTSGAQSLRVKQWIDGDFVDSDNHRLISVNDREHPTMTVFRASQYQPASDDSQGSNRSIWSKPVWLPFVVSDDGDESISNFADSTTSTVTTGHREQSNDDDEIIVGSNQAYQPLPLTPLVSLSVILALMSSS